MKFNNVKHLALFSLTIAISIGAGFLLFNGKYNQLKVTNKNSFESREWKDYEKEIKEKRKSEIINLAKSYVDEKSISLKEDLYIVEIDSIDYFVSPDKIYKIKSGNTSIKVPKYKPLEPYALKSNTQINIIGYEITKQSSSDLDINDVLIKLQVDSKTLKMNLVQFEKNFIFNEQDLTVVQSHQQKRTYPLAGYMCTKKNIYEYTDKAIVAGEINKYMDYMKSKVKKLSGIFGTYLIRAESDKDYEFCFSVNMPAEEDYVTMELNRVFHFSEYSFRTLNE